MFKNKVISILIIFSVFFSLTQSISFAEIDVQHNIKEDLELIHNNWYTGPCRNGKATCVKNLIRYDGYHELVNELTECLKNVEDDKEEINFWIPILEKLGIVVVTAAGLYYVPTGTLLAGLSSVAFCQAVNNVIEPVGESVGYFTKIVINIKNKLAQWFGNANGEARNPNEGLVGMITSMLCGDGKESEEKVVLTKETKEKFIQDILKDLKSQIKKKKYQNNDVIVLSVDLNPKKLEYGLTFDTLGFDPYYNKSIDKYFK